MSIYREEILEHYRHPQNFGELSGVDFIIEEDNPLCGDKQKWFIKIREQENIKIIEQISFISEGCAISTAAGSFLSEHIKGQSLETLRKMNEDDMIDLFGIRVTPSRMQCLMLPLSALKKIYTNS